MKKWTQRDVEHVDVLDWFVDNDVDVDVATNVVIQNSQRDVISLIQRKVLLTRRKKIRSRKRTKSRAV